MALILILALMRARLASAQTDTKVSITKEWEGSVSGDGIVTIVVRDGSNEQIGPPCRIVAGTTCIIAVVPGTTYTVIETELPTGSISVGYTPSDGNDSNGLSFTASTGELFEVVVTNKVIDEIPVNERPVGGVTGFMVSGSESSSSNIILLSGGIAACLALAASGWFSRRRWLSKRTG